MACGAVLAAAHSVLQTDSLRDVLAKFFDSAFTSTPARMGWARIFTKYESSCSQGLRAAGAPLIRTYSTSPGWTTLRSSRTRGYRAEHIPAHLEPDWYDRYFRHLDGPTNHSLLRRIAAIQLVQWATQASVAEAAHFLGVDAERTLYTQDNIRIWLNSTHEVKDFGLALRDLAADLEGRTDDFTDYQRRREALRDWALTPAAWQHLTSQLGPPHGKQPVLDDRKRQDASVFVWVRVTRGEHLFAPRPIETEQSLPAQKRWAARRNTTWHQLTGPNPGPHYIALRRLLTEYAEQLARSIDSGTPATMP